MEVKKWEEQIMWSVAPVSIIHGECFKETDWLWEKKVNELPDSVFTAEVGLGLETNKLLARVRRFCICSWEQIILGELRFCSKEIALLALGGHGLLAPGDWERRDHFPFGPLHPGGYLIS